MKAGAGLAMTTGSLCLRRRFSALADSMVSSPVNDFGRWF